VAFSSSSVITKRFAANRFESQSWRRVWLTPRPCFWRPASSWAFPARTWTAHPDHGRSAHHARRNVEVLRKLVAPACRCFRLPAQTGLAARRFAAADLACGGFFSRGVKMASTAKESP